MAHGHNHHHNHHHGATSLLGQIKHSLTPHTHDAAEQIQSAEESTDEGIRTAWISLIILAATAGLQIVIVWLSGSLALLADTVHNISHLITTVPLLMAFYLSRRKPTYKYPYGLKRAEDLAGLLISLVIVATIVLIFVESIAALTRPPELTHIGWVFAAGLIGFLGNEFVAIYRIRSGQRIGSAALIAEGQHARADGLSSIAVVVGVIGVWLGFERADAIAGLLIAVVITMTMINSLALVVRRIFDGVDPKTMHALENAVAGVDGVEAVERVRARWVGHRMEADAVVVTRGDRPVTFVEGLVDDVHAAMRDVASNIDGITVEVRAG
ncbi:cation diffusion facilitator family transporter [Corynebacterium cystitidis]|uniref:cation diffusion facilitator family transporter n=1 Tax=Corynebacterium cystitidis TaxID=35757 RepID=UPI00211E274F|nr:cation diffusion facilitator family transporter [Corynebacterium cystitidis]